MKPFLFSFPLFFVGFFLLLNITVPFPIPGNAPIPEWVISQEAINRKIFDVISFPGRPFKEIGFFLVAPGTWALLTALVFSWLWRISAQRLRAAFTEPSVADSHAERGI
jgi:hypothetical protein